MGESHGGRGVIALAVEVVKRRVHVERAGGGVKDGEVLLTEVG